MLTDITNNRTILNDKWRETTFNKFLSQVIYGASFNTRANPIIANIDQTKRKQQFRLAENKEK